MSRFVCNICNKQFTTKYGLKKHNERKVPCIIGKPTNHQCNICNIFLSSKRNLDNHLFNHRFDAVNINNTIDDHLENNLIEEPINIILPNNSIEILPNNYIEILVEEYNYFKDEINRLKDELSKVNVENKKLKDENTKLNSMICTTNNGTINVDNSTNIDNSITNNIQINIIPFHEAIIDFKHIAESFKDPNSALYDFSKIFNYEHLCHCIGIAFFWVKPFSKRLSDKMD